VNLLVEGGGGGKVIFSLPLQVFFREFVSGLERRQELSQVWQPPSWAHPLSIFEQRLVFIYSEGYLAHLRRCGGS